MFSCNLCQSRFQLRRNLTQHLQFLHGQRSSNTAPESTSVLRAENDFELKQQDIALRGFLRSYVLQPTTNFVDPAVYLNRVKQILTELCQTTLSEWDALKLFMALKIQMVRDLDQVDTITPFLNSTQREILTENDIDDELTAGYEQILLKLDELVARGSGWAVNQVLCLHIHIAKYKVLNGGTTFEKLPKVLQAKGAIVNIINNDDRCFMWSVLAFKFPAKVHAERLYHYERFINQLNFTAISFPVKLKDVSRFERQNDISVNIFGFEDRVLPYRISKLNCSHHVNLMLYKGHYSFIRNLDRLLADQRKYHGKKFFCPRCLLPQYKQEQFDVHIRLCRNNEPTRAEMPTNATLKFQNYHRSQRVPYIIYADFESLVVPIDTTSQATTTAENSSTVLTHNHIPCGFGFVEVFQCCDVAPRFGNPIIYRDSDCAELFLNKIIILADSHAAKLDNPLPINMTPSDWERHNSALVCSICDENLSPFDRVRDHCHFCSQFRGTAHSECNLAYCNRRCIPVFFHNLKRYDSHILMRALGPICSSKGLEISCIAKTMEEYISFSITKRVSKNNGTNSKRLYWKLCFVDSYQFLSSSLQTLVSNLCSSGASAFKATNAAFESQLVSLLLRKGVYPYEYMDSWERFEEQSLPHKRAFYSSLSSEHITEEDYQHAQNVWNSFKISCLGEYHDLYLKTDVLLLCDVFESFRSFCVQHYKLDPAHYLTLPSFGFDACLRMTKVTLELLTDSNMYALFEKGIRGGISVVSYRYAKANNPYLDDYNPQCPPTYIIYIDMNNLYGAAMIEKLPVNEFKWLTQQEISEITWNSIDAMGDKGYILEVDLVYPTTLHSAHSDYPLAPEKLLVEDDMLSPYCESVRAATHSSACSIEKLVPNLGDKHNYIIHIRNLQLYLRLGLKLRTVHRAISFNQTMWMSQYINFNTSMRRDAGSEFEKDLFKLLNNAVFGKTMENVREYSDVKLVTTSQQFNKLVSNPRYKFSSIFTDDLVGVSMHKKQVQLCKPIFVGFTILELSKSMMYGFHYDIIQQRYGNKAHLCFTDTDSFIYAISTTDVYKDIGEMCAAFDTSNYPEDHPLHSNVNKKVVGKMKDELAGEPPSEFVGLRSKMYSLKCGQQSKMRAKGITKAVLKTKYRHATYRNILFEKSQRKDQMNAIRSNKHQIYSVSYVKVSLSAFDDKRYILNDGITTLPYFHADIMDCSQ